MCTFHCPVNLLTFQMHQWTGGRWVFASLNFLPVCLPSMMKRRKLFFKTYWIGVTFQNFSVRCAIIVVLAANYLSDTQFAMFLTSVEGRTPFSQRKRKFESHAVWAACMYPNSISLICILTLIWSTQTIQLAYTFRPSVCETACQRCPVTKTTALKERHCARYRLVWSLCILEQIVFFLYYTDIILRAKRMWKRKRVCGMWLACTLFSSSDIPWPEEDEALSEEAQACVDMLLSTDSQQRPTAEGTTLFLRIDFYLRWLIQNCLENFCKKQVYLRAWCMFNCPKLCNLTWTRNENAKRVFHNI